MELLGLGRVEEASRAVVGDDEVVLPAERGLLRVIGDPLQQGGVVIVAPGGVERSMGKARRVIDKRPRD